MKNVNGIALLNFNKTIRPGSDGVLHEFFSIVDLTVDIKATTVTMEFNNLFNGNKLLGKKDQLFAFLNLTL
ncbi:hypothetical protein C0J52_05274 [Blattella germanica]|nr:hypothetical protein C0J52_05274 [Blattella germanica]